MNAAGPGAPISCSGKIQWRPRLGPPEPEREVRLRPGQGHPSEPLLERLRHAAGEMNPYLLALAIGLAVLDLTCLLTRVPHFTLTRCIPDSPAASGKAGSVLTPAIDAALRSGT